MSKELSNDLDAGRAVKEAECIIRLNCQDDTLKMDTSDGGNADAFVKLHGKKFLYVKQLGWLHWNEKYWEQDDEAVMVAMRDSFDTRHDGFTRCGENEKASQTKRNTYKMEAAIKQAKSLLRKDIKEFDRNPDEINVDNGVLNLRTLELVPHDSSQLFTYCLRAPYDENADMSSVEDFMAKVLTKEGEETNQELVDFIQTALGYSLTGHTREEKLFYMYGELGRNGKGSITEALMELVPYPISMEVDFNTFTARRDGDSQNFDLADMKPSRMIFASESNKYQLLNPASIKKLTGGNYVRAAHKFKGFVTYRPQFKTWLSSNHKVNGDPDEHVMWNRVLVIEFPNSYQGREDTLLKDLLKSPEVQKGLLRWAAIGTKRWYEQGLHVPEQVKLATKKHQADVDTFSNWLDDATRPEKNHFVLNSAIYQNYKVWCEANGITPKGSYQFSEAMKLRGQERGFEKARTTDKQRARGYRGLRIVTEYRMIQGEKYLLEVDLDPESDTPLRNPSPVPPTPPVDDNDEDTPFEDHDDEMW